MPLNRMHGVIDFDSDADDIDAVRAINRSVRIIRGEEEFDVESVASLVALNAKAIKALKQEIQDIRDKMEIVKKSKSIDYELTMQAYHHNGPGHTSMSVNSNKTYGHGDSEQKLKEGLLTFMQTTLEDKRRRLEDAEVNMIERIALLYENAPNVNRPKNKTNGEIPKKNKSIGV